MHPPPEFFSNASKQWSAWILLLAFAVSLLVGSLVRTETGFSARLSHLFLDSYLKYTANGAVAQNSVVVDIDDVSLSAVGQWPWPRYRIASLVQEIAAEKPAAIGLDILFSEPDRTSLKNIRESYKQDFGLDISFVGTPSGLADNDGYLGHVLSTVHHLVGARYFYFDHINKAEISASPEFKFSGKTDLLKLPDAPGILNNTYEISSRLKYSGFLNNQVDGDGMLRRVPLLIRHRGVIYPQLALATYMRSLGVNSAVIEEDGNGPAIRIGNRVIPISEDGYALLHFNGSPSLYPSVSAVDVLNGHFSAAQFKGKTVFIGSSAVALNDLHSTIVDRSFPGLKIMSVIVDDIANDSFVREPVWGHTVLFATCIAMGLLISIIFIYLREPLQLLLATITLIAVLVSISIYLFASFGVFLAPVAPLLVVMFLFVVFIISKFAIEKKQGYAWYKKLANAQQVTMASMAAVAETRDPETGAHIKRTQNYVKSIALRLRDTGHYTDILTKEFIDLLFVSAPLHDIGKVGVPDHILLKPGPLTAAEFEIMKKHPEYGKDIIYSTAEKIEGDNFLVIAGEIAFTHHEKWDGTGYPRGLTGQDIPLAGRIMAVADVYDALISRRCYKPAFTHGDSLRIMRDARGKIFDPVILDAFFSIETQIVEIAAHYQDEVEPAVDIHHVVDEKEGLVSASAIG